MTIREFDELMAFVGLHKAANGAEPSAQDLWKAAYAAGQRAADERAAAIADAERAEFMAQAGRNDGRHSDMAFGSVNSAERIAAAIRNRKEQGVDTTLDTPKDQA